MLRKPKQNKTITEYGNKASKDHRRMDTKCMEQYLMRSVDKVALDGDENDQIHCFKLKY